MWPFEDTLHSQDPLRKYREWLKKWLFRGNRLNALAITALVLSISLLSAYGFYTWNNSKAAITQPTSSQKVAPIKEQKSIAEPPLNPEEMAKPVMGHALTGVGMSFSEVFNDYRYNTGVALAANPGEEVKAALPGTVSLVATGENGTKQVSLDHGNGWQSMYSGLDQVQVKAGQKLSQNEVIGTLGRYSRVNGVLENHLYFKMTRDGDPIDPNIYWK